MAFIKAGTLDPHGAPVLRQDIGGNSVVYVVGDALKVVSGFPVLATGGDVGVYGILMETETNKGVGVNTTGVAGAAMGSYINSFTMASDNQTVAKNRVVTDIAITSLYSAKLNAAIGTTTGSNLLGYMMDLTDETQLNESSATTGVAQMFNWGVDPLDSTKAIVNIRESVIFTAPY